FLFLQHPPRLAEGVQRFALEGRVHHAKEASKGLFFVARCRHGCYSTPVHPPKSTGLCPRNVSPWRSIAFALRTTSAGHLCSKRALCSRLVRGRAHGHRHTIA